MKAVAFSLALILFLGACATPPTKVKQAVERKRDVETYALTTPKVTPETVVIDARSALDYSTAHVPGSHNLDWKSFTEAEPSQRGVLQRDLFAIARRLARLGIEPSTHVVVLGNGLDGEGEEGRLAWMLAYLGVSNVQFADLDAMKFRLTNLVEDQPVRGAPMWKPVPRQDLNATRAEVLFVINKKAVHKPQAFKAGAAPLLYRIIDVRPENDYLGREGFGARYKVPNIDAVNIPWREFFDPAMRVRQDMADRLKRIDVRPEHRILVIGEDGGSSAAVTLALRSIGFTNVANYSGGLLDLLSSYSQ